MKNQNQNQKTPSVLDFFNVPQRSDNPREEFIDYWKYASSPKVKVFKSNENSGKWCIFVNPRSINNAWKKIKNACQEEKLFVAKSSTARSSETPNFPKYIICVYNEDWRDAKELTRIRQVLYDLGFKGPLKYKRDLETINGIYGENEYYIDEEK